MLNSKECVKLPLRVSVSKSVIAPAEILISLSVNPTTP